MASVLCRCVRSSGLRAGQPAREMATLKEISNRLKSVKNIQKITKSMKMVSAAKFARAERDLKPARAFGAGANVLYDRVQPEESDRVDPEAQNIMLVLSSDRGLCGAIHSSVVKSVRAELAETKEKTSLMVLGDKARQMLQKQHSDKFIVTFNEYGRMPPTFSDASFVAQQLLESEMPFTKGTIFYNRFKSVVAFQASQMGFISPGALSKADSLSVYDSVDASVLENYTEFSLAALVYGAMKDGAAAEQSSRMTAMEGASKNAGEMISTLTLKFNRTRQAVITRELIEIISGASALE
ncbi:ATP synthase subunit gamma, mitochondrial-like [Sycon ciliatum]|uniref:ATP synthase subunit gamma, mitochondrial-like n=1 Tax=Sycon ciliatum TaxID=27933 RepID=UPI0031F704D0